MKQAVKEAMQSEARLTKHNVGCNSPQQERRTVWRFKGEEEEEEERRENRTRATKIFANEMSASAILQYAPKVGELTMKCGPCVQIPWLKPACSGCCSLFLHLLLREEMICRV